ncbi:hypothetical protein AOQ84DRAFT_276407, partial [Glonium stellatum]
ENRWEDSQTTKLLELYDKGMKWEKIAERFPGRSVGACKSEYFKLRPLRSE